MTPRSFSHIALSELRATGHENPDGILIQLDEMILA